MPTFSISGPGNVTAGNNAVFTVTMSGSISSSTTIWYSTLSGTASAADGDYPNTYVNQPLTFTPGGSTAQQIIIPTLTSAGSSTESAESFSVGLQTTQTGNPFTSATATILPNSAPAPTFSISGPGNVTAGNNAVFTVTMSGSISSSTTIWYSTLSGTASAADGDYPNTYVNQPLTFTPGGSTAQQIIIPTLTSAGSSTESTESFSVGLQTTQTGNPFTSATATILPNSAPAPTFSISGPGNVTAGNNAVFTVTMSGSISSSTTIWYSTLSGTASAADGDYPNTYVNQPLTFTPGGSTAQQIIIPTLTSAGSSTESTESFSVGLQTTQTGNPFTSATATILPNSAPAPTFSISNAGTVTEGNNAVFTVTISGSISAPNTIWYSTFAGTASAAHGDYPNTYVNQPLTFTPGGSTAQQITIPTLVTQNAHPDTFSLGLQHTQTGGAFTTGTATIIANSGPPTFSISNAGAVTEGNNAVFTVTMSGSISSSTTIWYSTFAGTASAAHGDYPSTYVNQPLTFTPGGSNTQQIVIPTYVTQNAHPDTFSLGLQNTQTGGAFARGTATIVANNVAPPTPTAAPPISQFPTALLSTSAQPFYNSLVQQASPNLVSYLNTNTSITTPEMITLSPKYKTMVGAFNDNLDSADQVIGDLGDIWGITEIRDLIYDGVTVSNATNALLSGAGVLLQTPIVKSLIPAALDQGVEFGIGGIEVYLAFDTLAGTLAAATVSTPLVIIAAVGATIAGVDFGLQALHAATAASIAADPPDPNYQQVFVPAPIPANPMPATGLSANFEMASQSAITDIDQATRWMGAIDITENRYATALAANDANAASMQYAAFLNDVGLYMSAARAARADLASLSQEFQANGIGTQSATVQELTAALGQAQTQSASPEAISFLESLGFTDAQIQTMQQEVAAKTVPSSLSSGTAVLALKNLSSNFGMVTPNRPPADLDGDGNSDIPWQNTSTGQLALWLMNGSVPTSQSIIATVPMAWSAIGTGDFNSDGDSDLVWWNGSSGQLALWEMNGNTPILQQTIASVPVGWQVAGTGDFNGDGNSDLVWRNNATNQIALWEMNGTTPLLEQTIASVPAGWYIAGTGDFNGDGYSDLLWQNPATHQVAIWQMNGITPLSEQTIATLPTGWQVVGTGDFNGDGMADMLWQNRSSGQVAVWLMNGNTPTSETVIGSIANNWKAAQVGDFNGDGNSDVLWQNTSTGALTLWTVNGTSVSNVSSITAPSIAWQPGVAATAQAPSVSYDFYGAGTSDILWQNPSTNQIAIWQMTGTTPVVEQVVASVPAGWASAGVGDFNGDSKADILWQNLSTNQIALWEMSGTTPILEQTIATVPAGWSVAAVDDFYGLGTADILWRNSSTGQVAIWQMNGTTPVSQQTIATVPTAWQIAGTGNFYGPGTADILWFNATTHQIAIWQMSGATPVSQQTIATLPANWQVAGTGDFNGDGYDDILWQNTSTNQVAIWQMNGATPVTQTTIGTVPAGWTVAEVGHITGADNADILWSNASTGQVALWTMNGVTPTSQTTFATVPTAWNVVHAALTAGH